MKQSAFNRLKNHFLLICPRTGKFIGFRSPEGLFMIFTPIIGIIAIAWIIFRVATKPSRLSYPCVQVAIPFASSLGGYIAATIISAIAWVHLRKKAITKTVLYSAAIGMAGLSGSMILDEATEIKTTKVQTIVQAVNQPIGTAVGILPGRVVWVHNPDATNENCVVDAAGHAWFMAENMNQTVVDEMLSSGLKSVTGTTTDSAAWKAIFEFHNTTRGKGVVNYTQGEKIFIKINATSSWGGNFSNTNLSPTQNQYYGISETSVASVLAVLRQLVNVVGVAQNDIYIGDPLKHIYKHLYDVWHAEFPNVHYLDYSGFTNLGRERVVASTTATIHYSDHGTILKTNVWSGGYPGDNPIYNDKLYTIFENAEYMINIPMLKGHRRAGITMFAKNHFGSHTRGDASHLHNGLIAPTESPNVTRPGYGLYRVQVDLMTHKYLGKKNLIYIMDALWATSHELDKPRKWQIPPFNNDFMSSMFISLDPVAIESVGYDFLCSEYADASGIGEYVQMPGVDDYLHQAADSANWPQGFKYDPDSTNTYVESIGTHEHWNDSINKQYSRNLGTGSGIELIKISRTVAVEEKPIGVANDFAIYQNYPNPFNPSTTVRYHISHDGYIHLAVYDILGKEVVTLTNEMKSAGFHQTLWNATRIASGLYYIRLTVHQQHNIVYSQTIKTVLLK